MPTPILHHLTDDQANEVWDVLVELAGANERDRDTFVRYLTSPEPFGQEYRFIGVLGFGGKLHFNTFRGARVSCYPEHHTPETKSVLDAVNERLRRINAQGGYDAWETLFSVDDSSESRGS